MEIPIHGAMTERAGRDFRGVAATVVCDNGLTSDALSTLCMLMDKDKAMKTIQEYGAEAVIIDEDKNVYVSEGLKDRFTITAEDYKLAE